MAGAGPGWSHRLEGGGGLKEDTPPAHQQHLHPPGHSPSGPRAACGSRCRTWQRRRAEPQRPAAAAPSSPRSLPGSVPVPSPPPPLPPLPLRPRPRRHRPGPARPPPAPPGLPAPPAAIIPLQSERPPAGTGRGGKIVGEPREMGSCRARGANAEVTALSRLRGGVLV